MGFERILKMNPYHDHMGRFASGPGSSMNGFSVESLRKLRAWRRGTERSDLPKGVHAIESSEVGVNERTFSFREFFGLKKKVPAAVKEPMKRPPSMPSRPPKQYKRPDGHAPGPSVHEIFARAMQSKG